MKTSSKRKRKKFLILTFSTATFFACLFLSLNGILKNRLQRMDYQQIALLEYDTVFLSMYPIDQFREEDYAYYRGRTLFKSSYCIPSVSVFRDYLRQITESGNNVTTAYLGIQPESAAPYKLQELLQMYPDISFEVILSYPSAEYWRTLSQRDYEKNLTAFCNFLTAAPDIPEAHFYVFGAEEWLIANPGNYLDHWSVNGDIATMIMNNSDEGHGHLVTAENAASFGSELTTLTRNLRTHPLTYPDLSGHCVVFFGDSVIGNYTDSTSIPGVVSGLTGAEIYNCGYGGNSAAMTPDILISLPGIIDAFFRKDLSLLPEDTQVYAGMADYLENASSDKKTCFVINYGLNDYFSGYPILSDDPYDITTYSGAIRTAVKQIQERMPDAQIILCTPTFPAIFEYGAEPHGADGCVLTDYVEAVLSLSQELGTDVLDNYHGLGITPENQGDYLADQVHPNNDCRFLIGSRLSLMIR